MRKIRCKACGYETLANEKYVRASDECPICRKQNTMEVINKNFSADVSKQLSPELASMEKELRLSGHSGLWLMIEAVKDPKTRLRQRQCFFLVGGRLPSGLKK